MSIERNPYVADPFFGLKVLAGLGGDVNVSDEAINDMLATDGAEPYDFASAYSAAQGDWASQFSPKDLDTQDDYNWLSRYGSLAFDRLANQGWSYNDVLRRAEAEKQRLEGTSEWNDTRAAAHNMLLNQIRGTAFGMGQQPQQPTAMQRFMGMAGSLAEKGVNPMPLLQYFKAAEQNQEILARRRTLMDQIAQMRFSVKGNTEKVSGTQVYQNWLRAKAGEKKYKDWLDFQQAPTDTSGINPGRYGVVQRDRRSSRPGARY